METTTSPQHLQHLEQHLQQQQHIQEGLQLTKQQTKRVVTQPASEEFKPAELQVPPSRLEYAEGSPFEFELGNIMVQELRSFTKGFGNPTTQTSTPKFVEEVAAKVTKANKATELFQTMAIVSLNMGNLIMVVNNLKKKLIVGEKEKAMLQKKLDKQRDIQKGYKHNVKIWRKNKLEAEQKIEVFIEKLQDENEEFKCSTTWLKSHEEEM